MIEVVEDCGKGKEDTEWFLNNISRISKMMAVSCNGFKEQVLDLFKAIINQGGAKVNSKTPKSTLQKKVGVDKERELKRLQMPINYEKISREERRKRENLRL